MPSSDSPPTDTQAHRYRESFITQRQEEKDGSSWESRAPHYTIQAHLQIYRAGTTPPPSLQLPLNDLRLSSSSLVGRWR